MIDGKKIASLIQEQTFKEIETFQLSPCLKVCLVGENPASEIYVKNKQKTAKLIGIDCSIERFPANCSFEEIKSKIENWNQDDNIHGIIVQLPIPHHLDKHSILNSVSPTKDVDGFNSYNLGKLAQGNEPYFVSCTPAAIEHLLLIHQIPLQGKHVVIINDTIVVGRPLALILLRHNATVTLCNSHTENLTGIAKMADILIVAVGKRPHFCVDMQFVQKRFLAIVDVGINRIDDRICGDVDTEVLNCAEWFTPVPGGVGPLTIQFLLKNTVLSARMMKKTNKF